MTIASSSTTSPHEQTDPKSMDRSFLPIIQHLDVSKDIVYDERRMMHAGSFCDIYRGRLDGHRQTDVEIAIKRLRFHVGEAKALKARTRMHPQKNNIS